MDDDIEACLVMTPILERALNDFERSTVRIILERAALIPYGANLLGLVPQLRVVAECECGCGSVDFVPEWERLAEGAELVARAYGLNQRRSKVGVLLWGSREMIIALELRHLGIKGTGSAMPLPESIRKQ